MDRVDLFRIFTRVAESGSFTRAADMMGLSRSSVSVAVQELEARVGARLLNRTTRRVAVTQEGAMFLDRCRRLLEEVEEVEGLFRATDAPVGRLRVDLPGRIGRLVVAPRLPDFLDRYPGIQVALGVTDRAIDLIEEAADCVVRVGDLTDSGMIARAIGTLPLINVVSPGYVRRHGVPETPADLDRHLTVRYVSPSTDRPEPFEWVEQGTTRTREVGARVTVNGAEAYIACCLAGAGIIQIPAYDVQAHIDAGELIEVMPDFRAAPMPMTLLFPHRRHLPLRTRVFVDWLETVLRAATAGSASAGHA